MKREDKTQAQSVAAVLAAAVAAGGGPDARADAELLLAHALSRPRSWLYAHSDDLVPDDVARSYAALLRRSAAGEPVAYLVGRREFWSLDLEVTAATLVPRPEIAGGDA